MKALTLIPGYAVDDNGNAWSCRPINGKGNKNTDWRKIKPLLCSGGRYLQIGAHGKKYLIHRLVMMAFVGDCPAGMEVSHKNGNGHDNRLCNLEYINHAMNEAEKKAHGTSPRGEKNGSSKLTASDVIEIKKALSCSRKRGAQRRIAEKYCISEALVSNIKTGRLWK